MSMRTVINASTKESLGDMDEQPPSATAVGRPRMSDDDSTGEPGPNLTSARQTVENMREEGRIRSVDEALVMAFLSLAKAVDTHPENANLWRQYLESAKALRAVNDETEGGNDIKSLLARLSSPLRYPEEEASDAGRPSRGAGARARVRPDAVAKAGPRRRAGDSPKRSTGVPRNNRQRPAAER